jgi:hypothetical protein
MKKEKKKKLPIITSVTLRETEKNRTRRRSFPPDWFLAAMLYPP